MQKTIGKLVEIGESRRPLIFREMTRTDSRLRMVLMLSRALWNLVKLERYAEAEDRLRRFAGIFHAWHNEQQKSKI